MLSLPSMATRFFRAGVGTVVYNNARKIALFRRSQHPIGIWQLQQGGIDLGEYPEVTLWRELQEEIGLTTEAIEKVTEMPHWTIYEDEHSATDHDIPRIGQAHRWFFLKLKEGHTIDISLATDNEFDDWKWVTFEDAITCTRDKKRHVYETLHDFFISSIQ
jgi:putative (di)nucleoside polyphosphate hydrolase